jgi:hypothetical protein
MAYVLFLLVNAALFVRPGEILPAWQGLEVYFYVIAACALFGFPEVMKCLTERPLETQPITLCVLGIFVSVLIPPLLTMDVEEGWRTGFYFLKILVYYLLLVSLVSTPARLRGLIAMLVPCCAALALITILRYHGVLETTAKATVMDSLTSATGEVTFFERLQGTGIFQDPNDLCVMLAAAVPLALFLLLTDGNQLRRLLWVGTLLLYAYTILLTRSRGGMIALMTALGVCSWARYGWQRTVMLGAVGLPLLLLVFGGRQTDFSANEGTGQGRIQLWSDWLDEFRGHVPFGMGMQLPKEDGDGKALLPGEHTGHLAHNAYLQAFADTGFIGGSLFLSMYGLALLSISRVGQGSIILDPGQRALRPFVLAAVAGYAMGIVSLSLTFLVPTYLMPGLAVAFTRTTVCFPPQPPLRMDERMLGRCAVAGICFLIATYIFVRLFVHW